MKTSIACGWLLASLYLTGCMTSGGEILFDFDGDGSLDEDDCDSQNPNIYPGSPDEYGDGIDSNCDGADGIDSDGDGFASNAPLSDPLRDCNDSDPSWYPGAADSIDAGGADNNCDGTDGIDSDGDGWASQASGGQDCDDQDPDQAQAQDLDLDGISDCDGDCNDLDPSMHPGASELCDGKDNDCNAAADFENIAGGEIDGDGDGSPPCAEDCDDSDPSRDSRDDDGDGFSTCVGDCNDTSSAIYPGAYDEWGDSIDSDCDGVDGNDLDGDGHAGDALDDSADCDDSDGSVYPQDADGDGFTLCNDDCDDNDPNVFPYAAETVCDGVDSNCGSDDPSIEAQEQDIDGDGYLPCAPYLGTDPTLLGGADCDDTNAGLYPADADGDGATLCDGDCDDADPNRLPGATELVCDGFDSDCLIDIGEQDNDLDGQLPCEGDCDDHDPTMYGSDGDGDGRSPCGIDGMAGTNDDDCDDHDSSIYPGNTELCDGLDSDCIFDGGESDDDGDGYVECSPWVGSDPGIIGGQDCNDADPAQIPTDADGDGAAGCAGDCDETDPSIYPGAIDASCDGVDSDCLADPAEVDDDGDGWLDCLGYTGTVAGIAGGGDCDDSDPDFTPADADNDNWSSCGPDGVPGSADDDCDDQDDSVFPYAPDASCDGIDHDCHYDGDEIDDDGDGYPECGPYTGSDPTILGGGDCDDGDPNNVPLDADGDGLAGCAGDCDETDPSIYLGAPDLSCDGIDHDCLVDRDEIDVDGDGFMPCQGDCDDGNDHRYPGASELCNGIDDDCNGAPMGLEIDNDGDGFNECSGNDCDDYQSSIYPGAAEACDGIDNNCNGVLDDQLDADGDGWSTCGADGAIASGDEDCDDNDAGLNLSDSDGDGYVSCPSYVGSDPLIHGGEDCDDLDATRYPGNPAWERWYDADTDCSGDWGNSLRWASNASFSGEAASAGIDMVISAAGDVDGDDLDDILIAAPRYYDGQNESGKTYLFFGSSVTTASSFSLAAADADFLGSRGGKAGSSISSAGDVDGDGLDDILIGAEMGLGPIWLSVGTTYLLLGSSIASGGSFNSASAHATFVGEGINDYLGRSVSTAGDVDGDGLDDILIGAPENDDGSNQAGKSYLVLGSTIAAGGSFSSASADATFIGEAARDESGSSVSTAGDVDGDGLDDILIGAPWNDDASNSAGKSYLFFGSTIAAGGSFSLAVADATFVGEAAGDQSGSSVSTAGDVDGDGLDDILIGAPENDDSSSGAGKSYLVLASSIAAAGRFSLATADAAFVGEAAGDNSGASVSTAGDVNGDGLDDLLMAAPYNDSSGTNDAGKSYLILSPY